MIQTATLDAARSEQFGERLLGMMNQAALALMTSVGHRTGLFDSMRGQPAATSRQVAESAGLHDRYVREWLDAMVTGGFVEYDPVTARYRLPDEHAAWLTRSASPNNVAVVAQYFPILGSVEDEVVQCFRQGGGVPYSSFKRFHEVMAEDSGQTVLAGLFDHILPLEPGLMDSLERGLEVLDIGCGCGRAVILMAERFPASRFAGYDLSEEAIANARAEAARRGLTNVRFEVRDLTDFDEAGRYDLITAFDAIHDQAKPARVLAGIRRALESGGRFLMQDIAGSSHVHQNLDHPLAPLMYTVSTMHCMTVSLAQGGDGLGTMWGEERAQKMLGEAGFGTVRLHRLPHDIQNTYYLCRA
jgi:2-polyprenyl-3-methyl-5-hydroxy-6-metoxy-1,4-benzoquinol methylase